MTPIFAQQMTPEQQQKFNDELMKISYGPVGIAGSLLGLVFLVLLIILIVKMFQNNSTTMGVVTIITSLCCGIGPFIALIFGWMKSGEWNIRPLMLIYTVVLLLYTGIFGYQMTQIISVYQSVMPK